MFTGLKKHFDYFLVKDTRSTEEHMEMLKLHGNEFSFRVIYTRLNGPIYNYVLSSVKVKEVAEQITQDTFLKLYQYRDKYDGHGKVSSWLYTIARNSSYDYLKKKDALNFIAQLNKDDDSSFTVEDLVLEEMTPEDLAVENSSREIILNCMEQLSTKQGECLKQQVFFDLSYKDISENLNLSIAAVKSNIFKAKKALAICVEECSK